MRLVAAMRLPCAVLPGTLERRHGAIISIGSGLIKWLRRDLVIPRRHYAIAWPEQALPHPGRSRAPAAWLVSVRQEESATWTS